MLWPFLLQRLFVHHTDNSALEVQNLHDDGFMKRNIIFVLVICISHKVSLSDIHSRLDMKTCKNNLSFHLNKSIFISLIKREGRPGRI